MRRTAAAAVAVAGCLALAACGSSAPDDASSGGSSTSSSGTSTTSTSSPGGGTASGGGTAVSGTPVRVGFIEQTGGPEPQPTEAAGIKGALQYVNSHGGVNGHPLKIDVCSSDATPEVNVNCANTFVSNGDVLVLDGADESSGAEQPILDKAHISMSGVNAVNQTVDVSKNDFYFGPSLEAFATGPLQIIKKEGITSLAAAGPNSPASIEYITKLVAPAAKSLGLNFSMTYYNATNTNWATIAQTIASKHAQINGMLFGAEQACSELLTAMNTAGVSGERFMGSCSQFITTDGLKAATGVQEYSALWQPSMAKYAPPVIQSQLALYKSAMTAVGAANVVDQRGVGAFAEVMDAQQVVSMIKGSITGTTVTAQFRALKNYQPFLDPPATCDGTQWPGTSTCSATLLVTKVAADGGLQPVSPQGFEKLTP